MIISNMKNLNGLLGAEIRMRVAGKSVVYDFLRDTTPRGA